MDKDKELKGGTVSGAAIEGVNSGYPADMEDIPDPANGEKQVVKHEDGERFIQPAAGTVAAMFANSSSNFLTSIVNDGSPAMMARIYNAMNDNDGAIADIETERGTLEVQDFMAYPVTIINDDGEPVEQIRCVVVTPDGRSYGSVANGVFSSLQKLVSVVGMAPWKPALKLVPVRKKTRRGFYTLTFRLEAE